MSSVFALASSPLRRLAALWIFSLTACLLLAPRLVAVEPAGEVACPACRGTGVCQAGGCKDGKTPCPATCLKPDAPGWHKRKIDGFPDDYLWMEFKFKDGTNRIQYISDRHMGELIEHDASGAPVTRGRCPACEGTSRVACAACKGTAKCATCAGAGKFIRNEKLFTLSDAQGREMEAIVRSRQGDTLTVLRLADRKTFDIPLDKLSAESRELINQRFPR